MKKIKVGFIGLGEHIIQSHLVFLAKYNDVELVGAFDPSIKAFSEVEKEHGIYLKRYNTEEELIDSVDAVVIGSPDQFHFQQMSSVINAQKHVLCEKPLCSELEQVFAFTRVLQKAETFNLVVTSCHPRRFDPPYCWIKDNLAKFEQKFGRLLSVDLDFTYHEPAAEKAAPLTDYDLRFERINRNFIDTIKGNAENYLTKDDLITNSFFSVAFLDSDWVAFKGTSELY